MELIRPEMGGKEEKTSLQVMLEETLRMNSWSKGRDKKVAGSNTCLAQ